MINDSRFKKIWKDLMIRKARTLLTLAGLVMGLWGISTVIIGYVILSNDLKENFARTNPPNIILDVKSTGMVNLKSISEMMGVEHVENRPVLAGRLEIGKDNWLPLHLFVVEDFQNLRVAKFSSETGSFPPPKGTMIIERDGEVLIKFFQSPSSKPEGGHAGPKTPPAKEASSSRMRLQLPGGVKLFTEISGTVFDPGLAPSRMELMVYGYVTRETARSWMPDGFQNRLLIQVDPGQQGIRERQQLSNQIQGVLNEAGIEVVGTVFPPPGEHPHQFQMNSILFLLSGLGALALLMSAVLVLNLINSMLTNQIRQIGSLKAIGATSIQVAGLYLSSMFLLGLAASSIALPLALASGSRLARVMAAMLNFEILTAELPWLLYGAILLAGSLFPVLAAFPAVRRWSRVSVRDAMENFGVGKRETRGSWIDLIRLPLPLPIRLGVRNSLRIPKRFLLGVLTMWIGALVFMITMNIRSSLLETAAVEEASKPHDIQVTFESNVRWDQISWMTRLEAVDDVELWHVSVAKPQNLGAAESQAYPLFAVPSFTKAIVPNLIQGHWISDSRPRGVVANHRFMANYPHLEVGDRFSIEIEGNVAEVEICGVIKEFGGAALYMPANGYRTLTAAVEEEGRIALLTLKEGQSERQFTSVLEQHFDLAGLTASGVRTSRIASKVIRNHLDVIIVIVGVLAFLMLIVSGLGMASGIGTSVVERTRELGVLRAIGAAPGAINRILLMESMFVALVAYLMALFVAAPASRYLGAYFGTAIVEYPFDYRFSPQGIWLSLVVVVLLALIATYGPARMATRQPVREAVSYE